MNMIYDKSILQYLFFLSVVYFKYYICPVVMNHQFCLRNVLKDGKNALDF